MPIKPKSKKRGAKLADAEEHFTGEKSELSQIILNNAKYFGIEPAVTDEEIEQRIADMFADCVHIGAYPTVEKLAGCLGIARNTLFDWESNKCQNRPRRANIIKMAKERIAAIDAEAVSLGKLNTISYLFRAKNYYGLVDNVTVEHKAAQPLGAVEDQGMLVRALLKQLQVQNQTTIDVQPQDGQATIPATIAETSSDYSAQGQATIASDYSEPSDYQPEEQATISPLSALGKALAAELDAERLSGERLSSDYSAGSQGEDDPDIIDVLPEGEKS